MALIEREALLDIAEQQGHVTVDDILSADIIAAAPVVHGRWIHTDWAAHWSGRDECDQCGFREQGRRDISHFRFCPNCGARMDGGEDDG